ncbi:MAG: AEC family transporter [Ahrensia sp.]|nr:AEC family transporter [Ahrensia sp.]
MLDIFLAVLPVFILIATGYLAVRLAYMPTTLGDALNQFAIKIAVPTLLFRAMMNLDFQTAFSPGGLISFYTGAFTCFVLGIVLSRIFFARTPGESVSVGFAATFSNSVLLGLAIVERSFGQAALTPVFGVIAFHAPSLYIAGMLTMELMRRDGQPLGLTLRKAAKSIFANPLMIAILAGVVFNLSGLAMPEAPMSAINMLAGAAIPVALVGIGAAMTKYQIRASLSESLMVAVLSLIIHPLIAFALAHYVFELDPQIIRAIVTIAAMPPGMNIYIFAVMYDRAVSLAASAFLICTVLSIATITIWLYVLSAILP